MTGVRRLRGIARADFLRSVGVYVTRHRVYMARMRRSLFRISLLQAESIPLEDKQGEVPQGEHVVGAIRALLPLLGPKNVPVYICFAPELVVECQVLLPEAARDDIERVLEYELERLIPFRRDEIYYDYVAAGATAGKISISLFAVPKTLLDPVRDALTSGGFEPAGAESVATSLFNYLLFCNRHAPGADVIMGVQDDALVVDGLRTAKGWSTSSEILYTHRMPNSSWSRGLGKEMLQGLIDESPRFYGWGSVGDILAGNDNPKIQSKDLLELGRSRILMPASVTEEYVPAIGACLRGLRESALRVNFMPGAKDNVEAKASFGLNAFLAAVLLIGLVLWAGSYAIKDEIHLQQLESEMSRIQPLVKALEAKEQELKRLKAQFAKLSELGANRGEVIRILDELSRTIPAEAYLSNLRYRDNTVELRGSAVNSSNLIPLLEASGLFEKVGFNAPSTRRGGDNRESFSLTANIEGHRQSGGS